MKHATLYGLIALLAAICASIAFSVTGSYVWGAVGLAGTLVFTVFAYDVTQRRQQH